MLENKLGLKTQRELNREEERLTKLRAKELVDSGHLETFQVGTFTGLSQIHYYLFQDIYEFAGKLREVNIAKNDFRFAPLMFLEPALTHIDQMPQSNFDEIIEKYVEMNIAHPFRKAMGEPPEFGLI